MPTAGTPQTVTGVETGTVVPVAQTQNIQTQSTQHVVTETVIAVVTATPATVTTTPTPPVYLETNYSGTATAPSVIVAQAVDAISLSDQKKNSQDIYNFLTTRKLILGVTLSSGHPPS